MKLIILCRSIWRKLIGDPAHFSIENRAFNAISVFSLLLLGILLPFNIYIGLPNVWLVMVLAMLVQSAFYYFSRKHKRFRLSMTFYAIASYALLIFNFFVNSGSLGPTIFLLLLTFQLLIAFTRERLHKLWALTHITVIVSLLFVEYYRPDLVPNTYLRNSDRYFDLCSSLIIVLACMYAITIYLRSNYQKERRTSEAHAAFIEAQNKEIIHRKELLEEMNREKTKVISVLSHDLRGPLNSITSVLELLANYPVPEQRAKELKAGLLQTTKNTLDMLSNLLMWSSRQTNTVQTELTKVRLAEVVQQLVLQQESLALSKQISLRANVDDTVYLFADRKMMEVSVRNLINNAIKFTPEGGIVNIGAACEDGKCVLYVRDNGIGMTQEQLDMLFTLDIHSTYGTHNEKGIGLGLALVKDFAQLQNGSIRAESREGIGSAFFLEIPLYANLEEPAEPQLWAEKEA